MCLKADVDFLNSIFIFLFSGGIERVHGGGGLPVSKMRPRLRILRRLLPLHSQSQLGAQDNIASAAGELIPTKNIY